MLLNKLNVFSIKINSRKCIVKEIDSKTKNGFLDQNHIQGRCISSINLGLFFKDELVSIMTFGKRKITGKQAELELIRFCSKLNTKVHGAASKLFKYFINQFHPTRIVSYVDRRWFTGSMYETLGFVLDHILTPNYWYFNLEEGIRYHRVRFQKHKLPKLLEKFDPSLSEFENMKKHRYGRIWDCGNYVYKWSI